MIEIVAGIIEEGETPESLVRREIREEAGLEALDLEPFGTYLLSPGGTSATMYIFCARVDSSQPGACSDWMKKVKTFGLSSFRAMKPRHC